jgi:hypothetical protein
MRATSREQRQNVTGLDDPRQFPSPPAHITGQLAEATSLNPMSVRHFNMSSEQYSMCSSRCRSNVASVGGANSCARGCGLSHQMRAAVHTVHRGSAGQ